jgi:hypothetical protein
MSVKKRESTGGSKKLYVGFFSAKVIAVNPTKEEQAELLGYDLDDTAKDLVYEGTNEKKEDYVTLSFWLEVNHPDKPKINARFRITNKSVISEASGKTQYVNQSGTYSWSSDESGLAEWFTNFQDKNKNNIAPRIYTTAIQGEADLYNFLRSWYAQADFFDSETNILINKKEMFKDFDSYVENEYRNRIKLQMQYDAETDADVRSDLAKDIITGEVLGMATVRTVDKDGQVNTYQGVYREFLPSYLVKKLRIAVSGDIWTKEKGADKTLAKFYEQITGQHGCKDAYAIQMFTLFNENEHIQTSNEVMTGETGNTEIDF